MERYCFTLLYCGALFIFIKVQNIFSCFEDFFVPDLSTINFWSFVSKSIIHKKNQTNVGTKVSLSLKNQNLRYIIWTKQKKSMTSFLFHSYLIENIWIIIIWQIKIFSIIINIFILLTFTQSTHLTQHKHSMLFCCYACTAFLLEHWCLE